MGCDFRVEHAWTVPGLAGSGEAVARAPGEDHQYGVAGWTAAVGYACALLFVEGSAAHADEGDGEGFGARDCGELCGAGNDRSGRKGGSGVYATAGEADSDAAEWDGRGDCCGSAVLCHRTAFHYWPDYGCGRRVGVVGRLIRRWSGR